MKPLDLPLLADENIAPAVVSGLRARGCDVRTVEEQGLIGRPDADVLARATDDGRVVITHDLSFGRAAIRAGSRFVGIICVRPGHIAPEFVLGVIDALRESAISVQAPFVVIAERRATAVRVRARTQPPW